MKLALARQALAAALVSAGVAFAPAVSYAQSSPQQAVQKSERYKVVLQVSDGDPAKWNLALNNARNIQQDLGKGNVDVEIVAYGPGLPMLKSDSKVSDRLAQALDNNVGLMACENTMRNTKVKKDDMYGGIGYVDAGVVHIMKRQRGGWAYVRP
jgi:intracellular sulfur oxidation DsrE/DsrF family protein